MSHERRILKREKAPERQPVGIMELTSNHCHWPANLDCSLYCGKQTVVRNFRQQSWCSEHYKRAFRVKNVHNQED
jgi:hypothetical protein